MQHADLSFLTRDVALRLAEPHPGCASNHFVQFYDNDDRLIDGLTEFIRDGLRANDAMLVVMTEAHCAALLSRCAADGLDLDAARQEGRLVLRDANALLAQLMAQGTFDMTMLGSFASATFEALRRVPGVNRIRAFGEMVDLLCQQGDVATAIELEELWNDLAAHQPIQVGCAYQLDSFAREADTRPFLEICRQHKHVRPAHSSTESPDAPARELCLLQQQTHALSFECDRAQASRSEFLGVVSHELRTPLNGIVGYQELLRLEVAGPLTPRQHEYLDRIRVSAAQLNTLIDQVLSLTRLQNGLHEVQMVPVDACELARRALATVETLAARKQIALELQASRPVIPLLTDEDRLLQILLNLLSNSVKFTTQGSISLNVCAETDTVRFEVRDTGVGVDAADLTRIFDPFVQVNASTTRSHGGMGLGLAVSRDLARLLGGDISVHSTLGQGSIFTLRLPRSA